MAPTVSYNVIQWNLAQIWRNPAALWWCGCTVWVVTSSFWLQQIATLSTKEHLPPTPSFCKPKMGTLAPGTWEGATSWSSAGPPGMVGVWRSCQLKLFGLLLQKQYFCLTPVSNWCLQNKEVKALEILSIPVLVSAQNISIKNIASIICS